MLDIGGGSMSPPIVDMTVNHASARSIDGTEDGFEQL